MVTYSVDDEYIPYKIHNQLQFCLGYILVEMKFGMSTVCPNHYGQ